MVGDFLKMSAADLAAPYVDTQTDDVVAVRGLRVACDGADSAGHPRVWLTFDAVCGRVRCPYCSRVFVHAPETESESGPESGLA